MIKFSAVAVSDFNITHSNLTFNSGSTDNAAECVNITIADDGALEGDQTFTVTLSTPDPSVILGTRIATITITDNDG